MNSPVENKDERGCSCHPDEAITPCPKQHALWHCQHEAVLRGTHMIVPIDAPRKAKADGMKEAAEFVAAHVELPGTNQSGGVRVVEPRVPGSTNGMGYVDYFIARASQIEKGN